MDANFNLDSVVRKIPDFPHKGILFYDITSILSSPEAFRYCTNALCESIDPDTVTSIAAVEARGFLFAAPVAERLGLPLILVRKKGKLPGKTAEKEFALEYGTDRIQIQRNDIRKDDSVILIDDLVATGGTLKAAAELIEECGGKVTEIICIIGLPFLNSYAPLKKYRVRTLLDYDNEII